MNDLQAIGCGVTGCGAVMMLLGLIMLLNRKLLVTSNLLLLIGIPMMMGLRDFMKFLIQRTKIKGTVAFFLGIVLVFAKLAFPGLICEVVGCYWLFGGFLPLFFSLLSKIPVIGSFIPARLRKDGLDI